MKHYRSSIPKAAIERVVATFVTSPKKYIVECIWNGVVVGIRRFHESGELEYERPVKNGLAHGIVYFSDTPGRLSFAEPYANGLPHGTAKQWSESGKLMGTYLMKHGTGVDLWRNENFETELPFLSEARYIKDGKRHGFEWWLNEDQKSVWQECHFWNNELHGIERSWNGKGRLRKGYPKYWVHDKRVTKRQYLSESRRDPTLPRFREADNRPRRKFPPEIVLNSSAAGL